MKKLLAFLLIIALVFSLCACGVAKKDKDEDDNDNQSTSEKTEKPEKTDKPSDDGEPVEPDNDDSVEGAPKNTTKDYAGAYTQQSEVNEAFSQKVDSIVEAYQEAGGEHGDDLDMIMFLPLFSMDLAFTATLSEDDTALDGVKIAFEFFGMTDVEIEHPKKNSYILTATGSEGVKLEFDCKYDSGSGAMQMISLTDGEVTGFFEFVPMSGSSFAFQTESERAVVEFDKKGVKSFTYCVTKTDENGERDEYGADDAIFPSFNSADEDWLAPDGIDGLSQYYSYDGKTLTVIADPFFGDRVNVEIDG